MAGLEHPVPKAPHTIISSSSRYRILHLLGDIIDISSEDLHDDTRGRTDTRGR